MNKLSTIIATCCLALFGCSNENNASTASNPSETATNALTYRVATLYIYPPFSQNNGKGDVEGFDIDVLNYIAETQGFKLEYKPQNVWTGMLEGLDDGTHDIASGGVFMTPERQSKYGFSNPYMTTNNMLIFKDESASGKANATHFDEVLRKNNVFATEVGAPVHTSLKNLLHGRSDATIVDAKTPYAQVTSVLQGKAQVAYDNQRVYEYYIHKFANDPNTKLHGIVDTTTPASPLAFAVKKGNAELIQKLNTGLQEMQANGKYQELQQKWFGQTF